MGFLFYGHEVLQVECVIACVAGVERGRGRGNLGARESVSTPATQAKCVIVKYKATRLNKYVKQTGSYSCL